MKYDLILAGVGGQGILSIAFVVDNAALKAGVHFKQSEVHGMAQRGGAVSSHLRLADKPIFSDLVPLQGADMILSVEPMEALRYKEYLKPAGVFVTSSAPFVNIPDYPAPEAVLATLSERQGTVLVDADALAKAAGSARSQNMVMLGAASPRLPLSQEILEEFIGVLFGKKGEKVVEANVKAFRAGRAAATGA
jgi:indolepyruvate ferredoxin oxidoreductase beta subunit